MPMYFHMCLCVCSCRGLTRPRWFQHACFMYMWCSTLLFSPWIPQQGDIYPFALPWQTHADLEQTPDYDYMYLSAQMVVNRKRALCYISPSVYQFFNICLGINRLRHTCYQPTVIPGNARLDEVVLLLPLSGGLMPLVEACMARCGNTVIYAQWEKERMKGEIQWLNCMFFQGASA